MSKIRKFLTSCINNHKVYTPGETVVTAIKVADSSVKTPVNIDTETEGSVYSINGSIYPATGYERGRADTSAEGVIAIALEPKQAGETRYGSVMTKVGERMGTPFLCDEDKNVDFPVRRSSSSSDEEFYDIRNPSSVVIVGLAFNTGSEPYISEHVKSEETVDVSFPSAPRKRADTPFASVKLSKEEVDSWGYIPEEFDAELFKHASSRTIEDISEDWDAKIVEENEKMKERSKINLDWDDDNIGLKTLDEEKVMNSWREKQLLFEERESDEPIMPNAPPSSPDTKCDKSGLFDWGDAINHIILEDLLLNGGDRSSSPGHRKMISADELSDYYSMASSATPSAMSRCVTPSIREKLGATTPFLLSPSMSSTRLSDETFSPYEVLYSSDVLDNPAMLGIVVDVKLHNPEFFYNSDTMIFL